MLLKNKMKKKIVDLETNLDFKTRSPIQWQDHEVETFITIQGGPCYTWCTMLVQTHHILTQMHIAITSILEFVKICIVCDNSKYIWNKFVSIEWVGTLI